jgi:aryl-alcohol dehydrogenase-like predicted oxidoreductase
MPAKLALDRYRLLGRSALRVSPLCLGTMTFGTEWGWGSDSSVARAQLDLYAERGGNFIDTANFYTGGTSESLLGEFLEGRRDRFVLATKYTSNMRPGDPNAGGNHRKNLVQSLEASLTRLHTDHVDLYWVHVDDQLTPIEETMRALDHVVRQGKVLHVGISDMPAWKVAQANTLADFRGWSPFTALQVEYSLVQRAPERDLLPMAQALGLAVTPWSPLGGGVLAGKYTKGDLPKSDATAPASPSGTRKDVVVAFSMLTERTLAIADAVKAVAKEAGASPSQVAIRWLLEQPGVTSPILGARTLEQLKDTLGALDVRLSPEQLGKLDAASRIELGFPHDFLRSEMVRNVVTGGAAVEPTSCPRPHAD